MREHLDAETAVQIVRNPLFPGTPYDLRGEAACDARLRHDVVGNLPGAIQKFFPGNDFIDQSVFERLLRVNRLAREQSISSALHAQKLQEAAMNAVSGNGADVIVEIENDRVFAANGDVAHQA